MVARRPKSRAAYILLGMLFGWVGLHNLYAGRYFRAVLQAAITVFCFAAVFPVILVYLWAFLEVLTVTRDGWGLSMKI